MLATRHSRPSRRMLIAVVLLSSLVRHCEPMSIKRLTDPSSSSSPTLSRSSAESRSQNLGSPSELAWQAWLLLDSQTGGHSGFDSSSFLRRITPKSVFIAPALPALPPCADGYRADTMGRCVKNVNIDHEAHLGFLLQRLNNRYGNRGGNAEAHSSNSNHKKSTGPLQLNIPLISDNDRKSTLVDHEDARDSIKIPIITPPVRQVVDSKEETLPLETVVTIYERKNSSKLEEESSENVNDKRNDDDEALLPSSSSSQKETAGPLQLNIHLLPDTETKSTHVEESRDSTSVPIVTPAREVVSLTEETLPDETVATTYETENSSKAEEEEEKDEFLEDVSGDLDDNSEVESSNYSRKNSSGPLQLNIPLLSNTDAKLTTEDGEETGDSIEIPIIDPDREMVGLKEDKLPLETVSYDVVTLYDRNNSSETGDDENYENIGATTSDKGDQSTTSKLETEAPDEDFVDDTNDASFSVEWC